MNYPAASCEASVYYPQLQLRGIKPVYFAGVAQRKCKHFLCARAFAKISEEIGLNERNGPPDGGLRNGADLMSIQAPRGTRDIYGKEIRGWQALEAIIRDTCRRFGYGEIRTPIFEHTELFIRGVGETTDVVQKEMYTFTDKGDRSISLRPEVTAGVARAYIEHKMYGGTLPIKFYYVGPNFRYEKPQAGRLRQFYQFGVECYGANGPEADAEVIAVADSFIRQLGLKNVSLHINSLGNTECRLRYNETLRGYLEANAEALCPTCRDRMAKNPLRVLDCKVKTCQETIRNAPRTVDALYGDSLAHFETLQKLLTGMDLPFIIDPGIVRGLDYYTHTVFEFIADDFVAQNTVCGGGRYDNLVAECDGPATGAVGFGLGLDRLLLLLEQQGLDVTGDDQRDLFIGYVGENGRSTAPVLAQRLRDQGLSVETELLGRSVKAQMKYADKIGARYAAIIGDDEIANNCLALKHMATGDQRDVAFADLYIAIREEH